MPLFAFGADDVNNDDVLAISCIIEPDSGLRRQTS